MATPPFVPEAGDNSPEGLGELITQQLQQVFGWLLSPTLALSNASIWAKLDFQAQRISETMGGPTPQPYIYGQPKGISASKKIPPLTPRACNQLNSAFAPDFNVPNANYLQCTVPLCCNLHYFHI